jgi:hypothetical protein
MYRGTRILEPMVKCGDGSDGVRKRPGTVAGIHFFEDQAQSHTNLIIFWVISCGCARASCLLQTESAIRGAQMYQCKLYGARVFRIPKLKVARLWDDNRITLTRPMLGHVVQGLRGAT